MNIITTIPGKIHSLNENPHWRTKARTNARQRYAAFMSLKAAAKWHKAILPCTVTLTRIAPRPLDTHDNLRGGFKSTVDGVADWLGIKDNDPRVTWEYAQEKGAPKHYAARVEIQSTTPKGNP